MMSKIGLNNTRSEKEKWQAQLNMTEVISCVGVCHWHLVRWMCLISSQAHLTSTLRSQPVNSLEMVKCPRDSVIASPLFVDFGTEEINNAALSTLGVTATRRWTIPQQEAICFSQQFCDKFKGELKRVYNYAGIRLWLQHWYVKRHLWHGQVL